MERSLKHLRSEGFICAVVERWNPYANVRQDLWGFADLIAANGDIVLIQVTSTANLNAREQKIRSPEVWQTAKRWLRAGGRIELHGWAKRGKRGKRKTWTLEKREVTG